MIFAETERLRLRAWERGDLQRLTDLIGYWEVTRWLVRVPHPYTLQDAESYFALMNKTYETDKPEYFIVADKRDDLLMGAIGLHLPSETNPAPTDLEIGYWLGKNYWGQGYMSEAVKGVLPLAFARRHVTRVVSRTDPANDASKNLLRKAGFIFLGTFPREGVALRGSDTMTKWELMRANFEKQKA